MIEISDSYKKVNYIMPIFAIKTLPLDGNVDVAKILKKLGNELAEILGIGLNRLVIKWEYIPANNFLFNGEVSGIQEKSSHHPFVYVSAVREWSESVKHEIVKVFIECMGDELEIEQDNICIIFKSLVPGELFVSGNFIRVPEIKEGNKEELL